MTKISRRKRAAGALLAVAALAALLSRGPAPETSAADHRDGPLRVNPVTLRGLPAAAFPGTGGILARGRTGTSAPTGVNIPIAGGGMFRCGIHDDPFFFDAGAFSTLESTGAGFPRPVGQAHNFFGPNVN